MSTPKITNFFSKRKRPNFDDFPNSKKIKTLESDNHKKSTISKQTKSKTSRKHKTISKINQNEAITSTSFKDTFPLLQKFDFSLDKYKEPSLSVPIYSVPLEDSLKCTNESKIINMNINKEDLRGKELKVTDIRKKLANCSSLADLKDRLSNFAGTKSKLDQFLHEHNRSPIKKICTSSNKFNSPIKQLTHLSTTSSVNSSSKESPFKSVQPAYEKYKSLSIAGEPSLFLPHKYNTLLETFKSCDIVVSLLTNRTEIITFEKLKKAVQLMSKTNFEEKELGKIETVYPQAYIFRQEKNLPIFGKGRSQHYQLTIEANLKNDIVNKDDRKFCAGKLQQRKNIFHNNLLTITKRLHQDFLKTLKIDVEDNLLKRWHPAFKLDEIEDIVPAVLPQPPHQQQPLTAAQLLQSTNANKFDIKIRNALQIVAKMNLSKSGIFDKKPSDRIIDHAKINRNLFGCNKIDDKIKDCEVNVDKKIDENIIQNMPSLGNHTPIKCNMNELRPRLTPLKNNSLDDVVVVHKTNLKDVMITNKTSDIIKKESGISKPLNGVPESLLQRIQEKERAATAKEMTRDKATEKRREMLQRLPHLCRILRAAFISQKRPAIGLAEALHAITNSYTSGLSQGDAEKHVRLMLEVVPKFITSIVIARGEFLKINPKVELQDINQNIQDLVQQL